MYYVCNEKLIQLKTNLYNITMCKYSETPTHVERERERE